MAREEREDRGRELEGELVVFVAFGTDILWRRSRKRVSVVELSTAERVSERGIGFDGRTRERTGNFCWDPSCRDEDGVRLRNATSGVEGAGDLHFRLCFGVALSIHNKQP